MPATAEKTRPSAASNGRAYRATPVSLTGQPPSFFAAVANASGGQRGPRPTSAARQHDLRQSRRPTWRDLVQAALGDLGGEASLGELYEALSGTAHAARNPHWREKIRQVLQLSAEFEPLGGGRWRLVSAQRSTVPAA